MQRSRSITAEFTYNADPGPDTRSAILTHIVVKAANPASMPFEVTMGGAGLG